MKQCENAIKKCPDLSSPYDLMGNLKADENLPKESLTYYLKAWGQDLSNKRIQDKLDRSEKLVEELERKEAVAEIRDSHRLSCGVENSGDSFKIRGRVENWQCQR